MKLMRLDLIATGPFTAAAIDLNHTSANLHIVMGNNEAGKSSSLRAMIDFLFGYPGQAPEEFLHPYAKLRVGATLKMPSDQLLTLVRRKGNKKTIRDASDEEIVDDMVIAKHLYGLDRDMFESMFAIDHLRLREGGDEMANGNGRAGDMLFAAAAGLTQLTAAQTELKKLTDEIFTSSGRSGSLIALLKEFEVTKRSESEAALSLEKWEQVEAKVQRWTKEGDELNKRLASLGSEVRYIEQIQAATTTVKLWQREKEQLDELASVPLLSASFLADCEAMDRERTLLTRRLNELQLKKAELEKAAASLPPIPKQLAETSTFESIQRQFGQYTKAQFDRSKLISRQSELKHKADAIGERLKAMSSHVDLTKLVVDDIERLQISRLGNQRTVLFERFQSAQRDIDRLQVEIKSIETKQAKLSNLPDYRAIQALLPELRELVAEDKERNSIVEELTTLADSIEQNFVRLRLVATSREQIESLVVPDAQTIARHIDTQSRFDKDDRELEQQLRTLEQEIKDIDGDLRVLERDESLPTVSDLIESRRSRDEQIETLIGEIISTPSDSVQTRRQSKLLPNFSEFDERACEELRASVVKADDLADRMRILAEKVAKKTQLLERKARAEDRRGACEAERKLIATKRKAWWDEWQATWDGILSDVGEPFVMQSWLQRFNDLCESATKLRVLRSKAQTLTERVASTSERLKSILGQLQHPSTHDQSLRQMMTLIQSYLDEVQEKSLRGKQLEENRNEIEREFQAAQKRLVAAEKEWNDWQSAWLSSMTKLQFKDSMHPDDIQSLFAELAEYRRINDDRVEVEQRIRGIDRDSLEFFNELQSFAARLELDDCERSVEATMELCSRRVEEVVSNRQRHQTISDRKYALEKEFSEAEVQRTSLASSWSLTCEQVGCSNESLLEVAAAAHLKSVTQQRFDDLQKQLEQLAKSTPFEKFVEDVTVHAANPEQLDIDLRSKERELEGVREQYEHSFRELGSAQAELNQMSGSGAAAALAEQRESLTSMIESEIERLATLRIASKILTKAIEEYQTTNQGPVLQQASEYFSRMTCNSFARLKVDLNGKGEPCIVGVRASEAVVPVDGMSDGTKDQLYLALRLASLGVWMQRHNPLPLIVDDILVHFDDPRSIATLEVLAEFSRQTQVIFFTHHQHTVELARSSLPPDQWQLATIEQSA